MRHSEDKELRDFEIRQWFYILQKQYLMEGKDFRQASAQAYDDIGIRFSLRKESLRRYKNAGSRPRQERSRLMLEVRNNLSALKQIIQKIEKSICEQP